MIEKRRLFNEIPKTLVFFCNDKLVLKEHVIFFIPELNCLWRCLDPEEKRKHFESEQFMMREAEKLMVLDDKLKKGKYFNFLKEMSKVSKDNNEYIDLIIDLNANLIFYDKDLQRIDHYINLDYQEYKINKLDSIEYRKILDHYLYQK